MLYIFVSLQVCVFNQKQLICLHEWIVDGYNKDIAGIFQAIIVNVAWNMLLGARWTLRQMLDLVACRKIVFSSGGTY